MFSSFRRRIPANFYPLGYINSSTSTESLQTFLSPDAVVQEEADSSHLLEGFAEADDRSLKEDLRKSDLRIITHISLWLAIIYGLQIALRAVEIWGLAFLDGKELAAASAASVYMMITGLALGWGLSSFLDSTAPQAFAWSNPRELNTILQRTAVITIGFSIFPISFLWLRAESLLEKFGQEQRIARLAQLYIYFAWPGLLPSLLYVCVRKYMQVNGMIREIAFIVASSIPLSLLVNFVFVRLFRLHIIGSALSNSLINWYLLLLSIYITKRNAGKAQEFSLVWSANWKEKLNIRSTWNLLKLGLPGMVGTIADFPLEILTFFTGIFGKNAVAAQLISMAVVSFCMIIPSSLAIASTLLISGHLGLQSPIRARKIARLSLALSLLYASLSALAIAFWGFVVRTYGTKNNLYLILGEVTPPVALTQFFWSLSVVWSGILYGCGKQLSVAVIRILCHCVIGVFLGLLLAFELNWNLVGLPGIWTGVALGIGASGCLLLVRILFLDWTKEAASIQKRIKDLMKN
ncbi:uncharacterized protein VTP21DRAFT_2725 [Calcarisporiella thermophila]|uniref:uncharacterized protein n=1 Tax=Calcarisporiella thermophila TaxID=911321 RepID=UPI003742C5EA